MNLCLLTATNQAGAPGLYNRIPSPRIRTRRPSRDFQLHRACVVSGRLYRLLGLARCLGAALIAAALTASAQGQSSVTLGWTPDAGTNISGYKIYYGVASRIYTITNDVGNVTNATVSGLTSGCIYYFAATAYDTSGAESDYSTEVVYTNQAVALPTVVLSSPVSGASYTAPATISCAASVTANGHTITQVQFYNGATLLGTVAAAPYSYSWNSVSAGTYSLSAKAVYDSGSTIASTSTSVTVTSVPLPSIALTAPVNGASYAAPAAIGLAATVTANGHTITLVQFYNGATLLGAVAAMPYSFSWTNVSAGGYSLTAQAVYDSGSTVTSAPANVTCVNTTSVTTIWPATAVPGTVDDGPDSAVELGVKFRSDVAGSITGIRFYKATANTGTHLGHLWSSAGTLLASATFAGESASGWQQVNFATPVAVAANTVYVASYYATVGHYSDDVSYFSSKGADNPPLHALTNGVSGGNGVYAYGASSAFPNQTWQADNYWVDVVWQAQLAPSLTSIAVTPANPTILAGATQQFTAIGTYSDGSTQNLTSQATWVSSSIAVATVNGTGLATAVSAGTTTLSAALNGVAGSSTPTVAANPPTIALTTPANGASYAAPASINLAATITANGHTITKIQFYNGATLLSTVAAVPYSFAWTNVSAGSYNLTAQAVYDSGSSVASTPANVTVTNVPLPSIALTAPLSGASYTAPAAIGLAATVTANGHTITQVQFYNGATLLGTAAAAPYSFSWAKVSAGSYNLTAQAVYDSGSTVASTPANVTVTNVPLPSIALTAPVSGASYTAPAVIGLAASVTANGHTITQVQFYNGATLLGTVAAVPYSFSWANVSAGSYSLTAQAVYDSGGTVTSAPANVTCVNTSSVTTIWSATTVPGTLDDGPDSAVELGVKFRSDIAGSITGIRFYKATANTGTHLGNLWSSTGTLLASATFTGESASGWQQVNFATPVAIAANTVYVGSYHCTVGHYSEDDNYFASKGVDNPPLHALTNGVSGGNGVYAYGASSVFPNQTWNAANYWADVVFSAGTALPAPWQTVDIGNVGLVGSAYPSGSLWSVTGAGTLSGTADAFRFLYQPMSADGELRAQLSSVPNTSTNARVGVMIRETLTPGAQYAFMGISPGGTFRSQSRSGTSSSTAATVSSACAPPNVWARLVRTGNSLYSYQSTTGTNWTLVTSNSITMATNIYFGLAVASGTTNTLNTSTFTNLTVVP